MKGLLVVLFAMLLLHVATAQKCIRIQSSASVKVNVDWCSEPVTATLPTPIGYCANARCVSYHRLHIPTGQVKRGKYSVTEAFRYS